MQVGGGALLLCNVDNPAVLLDASIRFGNVLPIVPLVHSFASVEDPVDVQVEMYGVE